MAKILYIQASPRKQRSKSNKVADIFIDAYKKQNPGDQVDLLHLYDANLPSFDGATIQAKYTMMHGEDFTDDQKKAWNVVEQIIERFKSADKYVFSIPMWNFGIPYKLKQYIDIITQPSYTFDIDEEKEYVGLVTGKPALLVFARGGDYSDPEKEQMFDHQKSYMELILGFIGFTDINSVTIQPTLMGGPEVAAEKEKQVITKVTEIAKKF